MSTLTYAALALAGGGIGALGGVVAARVVTRRTEPTLRLADLRPLHWTVVDEYGKRWILVQSEYRTGNDGGTVTLVLRRAGDLRPARVES